MHQAICTPFSADDQFRLIETRGLAYRYPDGRAVLESVDLVIHEGDRVALVGHNGAGKTTLAKLLAGVYRPSSGEVLHRGGAPGAGPGGARLRVGMLFQDPDDQLFCNSLREDVAFGPLNLGVTPVEADRRVARSLAMVGLDGFLYKAPHHLSYGQRKRAALAAVLSMEPEVLILDEPTANLDSLQERLFWEFLKGFAGTLIVISHDLAFLFGVCDRALVIENGRVHHDTGMKELVTEPVYLRSHGLDYTFHFSCCEGDASGPLAAGTGRGDEALPGRHIHTHGHVHDAAHGHEDHSHHTHDDAAGPGHEHGHGRDHEHDHGSGHTHDHPHPHGGEHGGHVHTHAHRDLLEPHGGADDLGTPGRPGAESTDRPAEGEGDAVPILDLKDYSYRYPDGTWGLREVSIRIGRNDRLALVGENGAGKSTLALCLAGLSAGRGEIRLNGEVPRKRTGTSFAPDVGLVFQDPSDQLFCPSCREEVAFGPEQARLGRVDIARRVTEALRAVGLDGFEDRVPTRMSAGERKRLAIASVLAMSPGVLILDEPTANLDPGSEELLTRVLETISVPMVLISHDLRLIARLCRRVLVMHRGSVVRDYSTAEFLRDDGLVALNGLDFTYRNACCREIRRLQDKVSRGTTEG